MKGFPGFPEGKLRLTKIPSLFFSELLPDIDDLAELKVTLYAFWVFGQKEGHVRYLRLSDFLDDVQFINHDMLKGLPFEDNSVDKVYSHHTLEHLPHQLPDGKDALVFVMDEIGRVLKPDCEAHIIVPWVEHTNAWRHPAHYRFFNYDIFNWFNYGNPTPDHEAYGYKHKMKLIRNDIVDKCHIYAIFVGI